MSGQKKASIDGPKAKSVHHADNGQELGVFRFDHDVDAPEQPTEDRAVMFLMGVKGNKKMKTLTQLVRTGAPVTVIFQLGRTYDTSQQDLSKFLSIAPSTLGRRKKGGDLLSSAETDRAVRYARLHKLTNDMMRGDSEAANRWLKSPKKLFGGESPMERATSEAGASEVEQLIGRIRHGVFS